MIDVLLRKDCMKQAVKELAEKVLHPRCFWSIQNSSSLTALTVGCESCRKKYIELAQRPIQKFKKPGLRKVLLARNIELERKNALLASENQHLKKKLTELKEKKENHAHD